MVWYKKTLFVPYDIEIEKNDQMSVDRGHSPWRRQDETGIWTVIGYDPVKK